MSFFYNCLLTIGHSIRFVPVVKMKIDGIPVDLLFVALALDSVPDDIDVLDDNYLRDLDEPGVKPLELFSFHALMDGPLY